MKLPTLKYYHSVFPHPLNEEENLYSLAYKVLLCLLAFMLPLSIQASNYILIILVSVFITGVIFNRQSFSLKISSTLIFFWVYFALTFISLLFDHESNRYDFVKLLEGNFPFIVFPLLFSVHPLDPKFKKYLLKTFMAGCLTACMICIGYALYRNYFHEWDPTKIPNSFFFYYSGHFLSNWIFWDFFLHTELSSILNFHPSYFSLYITFSSVVLIQTLSFKQSVMRYACKISILIFFGLFILLLASRLFLLVYIVLIVLTLLYSLPRKFSWAAIGLATVVFFLFFLTSPLASERFGKQLLSFKNYQTPTPEEARNPMNLNGINLRILLWKESFTQIKSNWFWGHGFTGENDLTAHLASIGYEGMNYNCHNQFLEEWLRKGVIGFAFLLSFFIGYLFFAEGTFVSRLLILMLFLFCLFESVLVVYKGIAFISFFVPLLYINISSARTNG